MTTKTKRLIFKILYTAILGTIIAVLTIISIQQNKRLIAQEKHLDEQSTIIDSLLNRRMTVMDVKMYVTDKTRIKVYGRNNKGNINVPQEKHYVMTIDSVSTLRLER